MAIKLFLLMNVTGVLFLLYVLANFWKEGAREKSDARPDELDFMVEERNSVLIVTRMVACGTKSNGRVIPFQVQNQAPADPDKRTGRRAAIHEMQAERLSAK
jgi:hypothetical protein